MPAGPQARRPPPFGGLGVAIVTLFGDRGELDVKATAGLAARLAARR
jgi:hypothetical protein